MLETVLGILALAFIALCVGGLFAMAICFR
jgi:hypothetical protein